MKRLLRRMIENPGPVTRPLLRQTLGRLPRRSGATGALARDGGEPVRDVRFRPWPTVHDGNIVNWTTEVRGLFRRTYLNGVEGLPQPLARQFSDQWARYCGAKHGLLVGHGTDALRIALAAVLDHDGLSYGGEVIVPNFSFIASATAALDRRMGVALVDVDPETLLIDPDRVEEAIVPGRTKAIMAVHLFGQPADMTRLRAVARRYDLKIVEDAAQAHGASWNGCRVGSLGDAGAFSFQSSKNLSSGEGGAIVTSDDAVMERAYAIHNVGRSRTKGGRWEHETLGWNCRPTEYQAALLLHRVKTFDRRQKVRAGNFRRLRELIDDCQSVRALATHSDVDAHGMYMFVMRYRPECCGGTDIDAFVRAVRAEGIPIARGFSSTIAQQPAIQRLLAAHPDYVRVQPTPVADRAACDTVYIPHEVFLGRGEEMDDIAFAIRKVEAALSSTAAARNQARLGGT